MRVVFLTHNYPRTSSDLAGGFLHPLAQALRADGLDVRVVAPSDRGRGGSDVLDGVPIRRVRYSSAAGETLAYEGRMVERVATPCGVLRLGRLCRALRHATREEIGGSPGPAVVHAHWWVPSGLAAPPDLPLVITLHGTDGRLLARNRLARAVARPLLRRAQMLTTVSTALAEIVQARVGRGIPRSHVIPMPVATEGWPWSRGGAGIVVVARLTGQKRVALLIEAIAILASRGQPMVCTVVGDGPERHALAALAEGRGLRDSVIFTGAVAPHDVPARLASADLFVLPAHQEGFGLAAVEALMVGVPVVVCNDGGGLLDIVPADGSGRHAEPLPDALAAAMVDVLQDAEARPAARREGQIWRERLAPQAIARRFRAVYQEAVGG